jgi:hypothetical protein
VGVVAAWKRDDDQRAGHVAHEGIGSRAGEQPGEPTDAGRTDNEQLCVFRLADEDLDGRRCRGGLVEGPPKRGFGLVRVVDPDDDSPSS